MSPDHGKARVLFVCSTNSGRTAMAAAFMDAFSQGRVAVISAVTDRSAVPAPRVVEAMAEAGIPDLNAYESAPLSTEVAQFADYTVALDCAIDGLGRVDADWRIADPAGKSLREVRAIRDDIRAAAHALAMRFLEAVTPVP